MDTGQLVDFARNQLTQGMSPYAAQQLLQMSRARRYESGELIYRPGEQHHHLYMVSQGAAKLWVKERQPLILEIMLPGEVFGEFCGGGHEGPEEYAEALGETELRLFPVHTMFESLNGDGGVLASRLLECACRRAGEARRQWTHSLNEDVPQRLARRLLELLRQVPEGPDVATIPVRLRQEDLAYMVGSTRTTVSEILNDFERRGLLELKRACFRVDRRRMRAAFWPNAVAARAAGA